MMKTKYERMSKEEKKEIKLKFKKEKIELYKRFRTMHLLISLGFIYSAIALIFDCFIVKKGSNAIIDIALLMFCLFAHIAFDVRLKNLSGFCIVNNFSSTVSAGGTSDNRNVPFFQHFLGNHNVALSDVHYI